MIEQMIFLGVPFFSKLTSCPFFRVCSSLTKLDSDVINTNSRLAVRTIQLSSLLHEIQTKMENRDTNKEREGEKISATIRRPLMRPELIIGRRRGSHSTRLGEKLPKHRGLIHPAIHSSMHKTILSSSK